jgi:acyl-coenzyme A synthetase/AMP-(fatty) acid ligase
MFEEDWKEERKSGIRGMILLDRGYMSTEDKSAYSEAKRIMGHWGYHVVLYTELVSPSQIPYQRQKGSIMPDHIAFLPYTSGTTGKQD